jgi:hypothetical protein
MKSVPYDGRFPVCEDVDMFARFTDDFCAENLPLFLIARRIHSGQTIRSNVERIIDRQMAISSRSLARLDLKHHPDEVRRHVILGGSFQGRISNGLIDWAEGWFERILAANVRSRVYEEGALKAVFDLIAMRAALRRFGKDPAKVGRLARVVARHPGGALAMARDAAMPLLPIKGRPSAAGLRPLLKT